MVIGESAEGLVGAPSTKSYQPKRDDKKFNALNHSLDNLEVDERPFGCYIICMKIGDLVKFEADNAIDTVGVIIAESPWNPLLAEAFVVLWSSGELVERTNPGILEVISESR